jgi:hypothetical protein
VYMPTALTCPQIKEIYDTLYSETGAVYEKLLPIDSKSDFESIEPLIVEIQTKYFALLSDTGNEKLEKEYICAVNPDIARALRKDINGFWYVWKKDGNEILYHPITKERIEEFEDIGIPDTNGFWRATKTDGNWILYHPITKERIEEFDSIYQCDENGFWDVKKSDGGNILYNPITKERVEEFKGIRECDTNGFWKVTTMDGKKIKYNPATKEYKK